MIEPRRGTRLVGLPMMLLEPGQHVRGMVCARRVFFSMCAQLRGGKGARAFQEREAHVAIRQRAALHQALLHQRLHRGQQGGVIELERRRRRGEIEAAWKDGKAAKDSLFPGRQPIVTPPDRRMERPVPRRKVA